MREMYKNMGICDEVYDYCDNIIKSLHDRFEEIGVRYAGNITR